MQVFEVMAIRKDEKGQPRDIIISPYTLIASNEEAAKMSVIVSNHTTFIGANMNEVAILVRPFK